MPKFYRSVYSTVANIPPRRSRKKERKKEGRNASERKLSDYVRTIFYSFFFFLEFKIGCCHRASASARKNVGVTRRAYAKRFLRKGE